MVKSMTTKLAPRVDKRKLGHIHDPRLDAQGRLGRRVCVSSLLPLRPQRTSRWMHYPCSPAVAQAQWQHLSMPPRTAETLGRCLRCHHGQSAQRTLPFACDASCILALHCLCCHPSWSATCFFQASSNRQPLLHGPLSRYFLLLSRRPRTSCRCCMALFLVPSLPQARAKSAASPAV